MMTLLARAGMPARRSGSVAGGAQKKRSRGGLGSGFGMAWTCYPFRGLFPSAYRAEGPNGHCHHTLHQAKCLVKDYFLKKGTAFGEGLPRDIMICGSRGSAMRKRTGACLEAIQQAFPGGSSNRSSVLSSRRRLMPSPRCMQGCLILPRPSAPSKCAQPPLGMGTLTIGAPHSGQGCR